jgi:putative transposase
MGHHRLILDGAGPDADNRLMPRGARDAQGGYCYHVLNRGNGRRTVFHKAGDYAAFLKVARRSGRSGRHAALGLLPDAQSFSFGRVAGLRRRSEPLHDVAHDGSRARYHQHYHSSGHVWQGRFQAFARKEKGRKEKGTPYTKVGR